MTIRPTYTSDWFTPWIPIWTKHVIPRFVGIPRIRWLEVGSYEGRSALWALDNFLTGEGSTITCIDLWSPAVRDVEDRFDANVAGRLNLVKCKGLSRDVLPTLSKESFHGIYIDGSHDKDEVLCDAELALPLLRPGALLIFDDYEYGPCRWSDFLNPEEVRQPVFGVREAVDTFLDRRSEEFEVLHRGWQLFLRRR